LLSGFPAFKRPAAAIDNLKQRQLQS